jgi:ATP-dependent Clp protease ATP-binding subunit ClpC
MDGETQEGHDGPYGFGPNRTLRDYEIYSGLLFEKRAIQKYLEDPMAEEIIKSNLSEGDEIEIDYNKEKDEVIVSTHKPKKTKSKKEDKA